MIVIARHVSLDAARNGFLDCLRFVAALGIVLFHLKLPWASIGLSALSFFAAIFCFFASQYSGQNGFVFQFNRLVKRIMLPWFVWSLIYLLSKFVDAYVSGHSYFNEFEFYMLWTGPSIHLWFLPFSFTICLFITQTVSPIRVNSTNYYSMTVCLFFLSIICGKFIADKLVGVPLIQWFSVLPACLLGVICAAAERRLERLFVLAASVFFGFLAAQAFGYSVWFQQFLIGGTASIIAVLWNPGSNRLTLWLGEISLGIYLSHPLCFAIVRKFTNQDANWLSFTFTVVLSIMMAEVYRNGEKILKNLLARKKAPIGQHVI